MKKTLLSLGSIAAVSTPIAMVVSCGVDLTNLDENKAKAIASIENSNLWERDRDDCIKKIKNAKDNQVLTKLIEYYGKQLNIDFGNGAKTTTPTKAETTGAAKQFTQIIPKTINGDIPTIYKIIPSINKPVKVI